MFDFTFSDFYTVLLKQFLTITETVMGGFKKKKGVGPVLKCGGGEPNQNPDCYVALLRRVENKLKVSGVLHGVQRG